MHLSCRFLWFVLEDRSPLLYNSQLLYQQQKERKMGNACTSAPTIPDISIQRRPPDLITKQHLSIFPSQQHSPLLSPIKPQPGVLNTSVLHSDYIPGTQLSKSILLPNRPIIQAAPQIPSQQKIPYNSSFYESLRLPDYEYPNMVDRSFQNCEYRQLEESGREYLGECVGNEPHGKGVLRTNYEMYIGWFWNGEKNGHGREVLTDQVYEGEFTKGKRHGQGVRYKGVTNDDGRYVLDKKEIGEFDLGLVKGEIKYRDGSVYYGELENGLRKTQSGMFVWPDGVQYKGHFYNDLIHGEGLLTFPDGKKYFGQFVKEKKHGKGTFTWPLPDGDTMKYDGEYVNGLKEGKGKLWISEKQNDYYQGEFLNDKPHGKGKLKDMKPERNVQFCKGKLINEQR